MMDWGIAMMVAMLVFWVAVIVAVVFLIRHLIRERDVGRSRGDGEDGLRVLDRRFAAGEIDSDEYRERRAILERER